jgi:hypothetical protein
MLRKGEKTKHQKGEKTQRTITWNCPKQPSVT